MEERYPYIRFVLDAAQVIAGAVALIVFLGGTLSACHHGGFGGFVGFLIAIAIAGVAYVAVMVQLETLRVLVDIESGARQLLAQREPGGPAPPGTTA